MKTNLSIFQATSRNELARKYGLRHIRLPMQSKVLSTYLNHCRLMALTPIRKKKQHTNLKHCNTTVSGLASFLQLFHSFLFTVLVAKSWIELLHKFLSLLSFLLTHSLLLLLLFSFSQSVSLCLFSITFDFILNFVLQIKTLLIMTHGNKDHI